MEFNEEHWSTPPPIVEEKVGCGEHDGDDSSDHSILKASEITSEISVKGERGGSTSSSLYETPSSAASKTSATGVLYDENVSSSADTPTKSISLNSSGYTEAVDVEEGEESSKTCVTSSAGEEEEVRVFEYLESPVSDGTIEENFEEELAAAPFIPSEPDSPGTSTTPLQDEEDFGDISQHGIVEVVGDDAYGRKIIVVAACKLPSNKTFDQQRFLRYLLYTLDQYVEQDYSLVYFHHGLNSKNKPTLGWLYQAYKAFHRKYKKNLKALYLVHPTNFIKLTFQLFKPVVSAKFGRKVMYINHLSELNQHIRLDQLCIPGAVHEHDAQLVSKTTNKSSSSSSTQQNTNTSSYSYGGGGGGSSSSTIGVNGKTPLETQQFGVSLTFIKEHNEGEIIPPILRQCVEYLSQPEALATDGIFRRSTSTVLVRESQEKANRGEEIQFNGDFHLAAVLIKAFLRELEEPLLTFDLFDEIVEFQKLSKDERGPFVKQIVLEKLPEDNYYVLKYIIQFLGKVSDSSDFNKMTSSNLAVVFGPNLLWSENLTLNLAAIAPINTFTEWMLSHQDEIFLI